MCHHHQTLLGVLLFLDAFARALLPISPIGLRLVPRLTRLIEEDASLTHRRSRGFLDCFVLLLEWWGRRSDLSLTSKWSHMYGMAWQGMTSCWTGRAAYKQAQVRLRCTPYPPSCLASDSALTQQPRIMEGRTCGYFSAVRVGCFIFNSLVATNNALSDVAEAPCLACLSRYIRGNDTALTQVASLKENLVKGTQ